jgi:uncharacterized repeat protein (TIGR03803 family)
MVSETHLLHSTLRISSVLIALLVLALASLFAAPASAQISFNVLHNFTDGVDGSFPAGGLTADTAGSLFGTTCGVACSSTSHSNGTVYRLAARGTGWVLTPLYQFRGGNDGVGPTGNITIGPDGSLYGTTFQGGGAGCGGSGCGTVFRLQPPPTVTPNIFGNWVETVLYRFRGGADGANPEFATLIFDQSGNMYGETSAGGAYGQGTVFELSPIPGGWTESVIYTFGAPGDGAEPLGGLNWQCGGTLQGTTFYGGYGYGTIFQLTPSGSSWTESIVHNFQGGNDGAYPAAGVLTGCVVIGTTCSQGPNGGGTVFMLNDGLFYHYFTGDPGTIGGPWAPLAGDETGLFGTTYRDGTYQAGNVFALEGCAGWGYTSLHDFTSGQDGGYPLSNLVVQSGTTTNLFGTTAAGGAYGGGVIFEISGNLTEMSQCSGLKK